MSISKKDKLKASLQTAPKSESQVQAPSKPVVVEANGQLCRLLVSAIKPDPNQPREKFDPKFIESLAHKLQTDGQHQPITVVMTGKNQYKIRNGENRWRAASHAGLEYIDAIVYEYEPEELTATEQAEILRKQKSDNDDRRPLTPWEDIKTCARYLTLSGKQHQEAAEDLDLSKAELSKRLKIYNGPEEIQNLVRAEALTNFNTLGSLVELWKLDQEFAEKETKKILEAGKVPSGAEQKLAARVKALKNGEDVSWSRTKKEQPRTAAPEPTTLSAKTVNVAAKGILEIQDSKGNAVRLKVPRSWRKDWEKIGEALFGGKL
ncbi:MAG: ParB/RepB/Spo0J family partition protein [Thalassospira sp.]|nr:ParB/RepB/Spo0J family partition protein [Thalassospira sp.]